MNLIDIKQKLGKAAGNTQFLIVFLIIIIFVIAALFMYRRSVAGRLNKNYVTNNEFSKNGGNGGKAITSADIYFFYTEWCPHCKTAKPIWFEFKKDMEGQTVNGVKLHFFEVDCDKDSETSDKFKVKGFPTIKLIKGKQIIEYDAKPSVATLHEFVKSALAN